MQYSIPQFIEEEGKIIFFLTFRQFFLLVGGGAVCLLLYYILPFWLFAILSIVIMLMVAAIAFLKIGNESIIKVLLHFIGFSLAKKNYIWKKKELSESLNTPIRKSGLWNTKKIMETKR